MKVAHRSDLMSDCECFRSSWTPLAEVARILTDWTEGRARLSSGSLVALLTQAGSTSLQSC